MGPLFSARFSRYGNASWTDGRPQHQQTVSTWHHLPADLLLHGSSSALHEGVMATWHHSSMGETWTAPGTWIRPSSSNHVVTCASFSPTIIKFISVQTESHYLQDTVCYDVFYLLRSLQVSHLETHYTSAYLYPYGYRLHMTQTGGILQQCSPFTGSTPRQFSNILSQIVYY